VYLFAPISRVLRLHLIHSGCNKDSWHSSPVNVNEEMLVEEGRGGEGAPLLRDLETQTYIG